MRNINLDATRIKSLQEASMFDECLINTYSETTDSYKDTIKAWTSGSTSASSVCGVNTTGGNKNYKEEEIQIKSDAVIRLPLATVITEKDTITVTKQNNTTVNVTYSILNNISIGHGEYVIKCQKLQV